MSDQGERAPTTAYAQPGYYYEHTDGSIHWKPDRVVEMGGGPYEYFQGPFVKRWWHVS